MADFDNANLKLYKCLNYAEDSDHGGDIDTGNPITDDVKNNIFDDISDIELRYGYTDFRKFFIKNEDDDIYPYPKLWIDTNTPGTADSIAIRLGGSKGKLGVPVQCSGTASFTNGSAAVTTTSDLRGELVPGEKIYNSTDDPEGSAVEIAAITNTTITLASNYLGTTGSSKDISVASLEDCHFSTPDSKTHPSVLTPLTMAVGGYFGIWVKRVCVASGKPIAGNYFKLALEYSDGDIPFHVSIGGASSVSGSLTVT